jgi:hypothetical protein
MAGHVGIGGRHVRLEVPGVRPDLEEREELFLNIDCHALTP